MANDRKVIPLHRQPVDYDGPRFVHPVEGGESVDLGAWLNRRRSPFRDFIADLRDHADILTFGLTIGICIGCLGTVGLAFAAVLF